MPLKDTDYDLIDKYLLSRLDSVEEKHFAQRQRDTDFKKELHWRKEMRLVFKKKGRADMKSRLQALEKEKNNNTRIDEKKPTSFLRVVGRNWLSLAAGMALVLSSVWWLNNQTSNPNDLFAAHYEPYPNIIAPIVKSETSATDYDLAFQRYEQGQYGEALQLLEQLPTTDEAVNFYQGLTLIAQQDWERASAVLIPISENDQHRFSLPAQWYLALTYLQLGVTEKTKSLLTQISTIAKHPFQKKATILLENL